MRNILTHRHRPVLAEFASSNVVVALDYDGTLAPITVEPARAGMRPPTRRLLKAVARHYPCVVISGRQRQDVAARLGNIPVRHIFGNHGLEPSHRGPAFARRVRAWKQQLERHLPRRAGLILEDKVYSLTIHYRRVAHKAAALKDIDDVIRRLRGVRTIGGRQVVNLVPRRAPNKGTAVEKARRLLGGDRVIYIGDDETDEDAFRAAPPERLLAIRVGAARRSAARYYLKGQTDIDRFLKELLRLRSTKGGALEPNG